MSIPKKPESIMKAALPPERKPKKYSAEAGAVEPPITTTTIPVDTTDVTVVGVTPVAVVANAAVAVPLPQPVVDPVVPNNAIVVPAPVKPEPVHHQASFWDDVVGNVVNVIKHVISPGSVEAPVDESNIPVEHPVDPANFNDPIPSVDSPPSPAPVVKKRKKQPLVPTEISAMPAADDDYFTRYKAPKKPVKEKKPRAPKKKK